MHLSDKSCGIALGVKDNFINESKAFQIAKNELTSSLLGEWVARLGWDHEFEDSATDEYDGASEPGYARTGHTLNSPLRMALCQTGKIR